MKNELERWFPSQEGINPEYIIDFLNACEKAETEIHGIMIARHGKVVFEAYNSPYAADIPHIMHSFTKILTNTAVALAYTDGLLALDDPILKYFPEYRKNANKYLSACTIRNMITMRNGQQRSIGGNEWRPLKSSWKDAYFQVPFDKKPGEVYMYSSGNSYILSYIVQKLEKKTCRELIWERIGKKIGLTEFSWMLSPEGVCSGGNGVSLTVEDMLRIGLLYLNKGKWKGEQLISRQWIDYAMGYLDPIPPENGLQYNFHWDHIDDIWAGRGMFGQICGQVPKLDMVFAMTAADEHYTAMRLFQTEIVDKVKADQETNWENASVKDEILTQKGLRMTLEGKNASVKEHIQLKEKDFVWIPEENCNGVKRVELHFERDHVRYVMEDSRGCHEVVAGLEHWICGKTTMTCSYLHHQYEQDISRISAIAYWNSANALMMEWRFPEMAFFDHVNILFDGEQVRMNRWVNMNSQARSCPTLILK